MKKYRLAAVISAVFFCACFKETYQTAKDDARKYLSYLDEKVCQGKYEQTSAEFNYSTNITEENLEKMEEQDGRPLLFDAEYKEFDWRSFNDSDMLRQAKYYGVLNKPMDPQIMKDFSDVVSAMTDVSNRPYLRCWYKNRSICGDEAEKYIKAVYDNPEKADPEELAFYWAQAFEGPSRGIRPYYELYVNVSNRLARASNYSNRADQRMGEYEDPPVEKFQSTMLGLWEELKPLYEQFLSYNRFNLRKYYGEDVISKTGGISKCFWEAVSFKPYPNKSSINITKELVKQNYTVMKIVETIEDYYKSMGLEGLPESFYTKSQFTKPKETISDCDRFAWDFYNKKDFRISMCGSVTAITTHILIHEMGHLHYSEGYKNQPCCYRIPANPGLDEGVADVMTLAFESYTHLQRLGLVEKSCKLDPEVIINTLYETFETKMKTIPYALAGEFWRWDLFKGNIGPQKYNQEYWNYRKKFEGIIPSGTRGEEYLDFAGDYSYGYDEPSISYFVAYIVEFQLYEGLCIKAGKYDPNDPNSKLHLCDLYGSKEAGKVLKKMYSLGASKPWTKGVRIVTGKPKLDVGSFKKFFQPLYRWLKEENKKNGEYIGWK